MLRDTFAMPLRPDTVDRVVAMWARRPVINDLPGVNIVVIGERTFVRAPAHLHARLADPPLDLDRLVTFLGDEVEHVVGVACLAYGDDATLRLPERVAAADIDDDDPRLRALERVSDRSEWLESSADEPADERVGVLGDDGRLLAVATLSIWDDTVGHVGVFTEAGARGRGLAGRASAAVVGRACDRALVPQWRSRVGNDASAAVAGRLGFVPLGMQMSVRVRPFTA
jgi:RimJ/RimL family protein N-acetyltransferase